MDKYRVFISYAHGDEDFVARVEGILQENGLQPMRDKNFAFGIGFHKQIKTFIAHAHAFVPVITESSNNRGWVHQEIGYAIALNVPVLPITVGTVPGEMLQTLNAVRLTKEESGGDLQAIVPQLSLEVFENLATRYRDSKYALYACAEHAEDRTRMMIEYAQSVLNLRQTGLVRQKGGLSSFHIPDKVISHKVWNERYGKVKKNQFHCSLQREERRVLEKHARQSGCRIIVFPQYEFKGYGPRARIVRLSNLLEFLERVLDIKVQIAVDETPGGTESKTLVGDWFYAESVSVTLEHGYRQTIFTRHAPSMHNKIELFDQEFDDLIKVQDWTPEGSRAGAIEYLKKLVAELSAKAKQRV